MYIQARLNSCGLAHLVTMFETAGGEKSNIKSYQLNNNNNDDDNNNYTDDNNNNVL